MIRKVINLKEHFKISYQSVKDTLKYILFFFIIWRLTIYFNGKGWLNGISKEILGESNLGILGWILILSVLIMFVYGISGGIIDLFYFMFLRKNPLYNSLKDFEVNIPISKKTYKEIKDNKLFFSRFQTGEDKIQREFSSIKLNDWCKKIIYKELEKLK